MRGKNISLAELPIWCSAAILFLGSVLLIAQLLLGAVAHGRQMKLCAALTGVQLSAEPVPLSVNNLLSGKFQTALARHIGTRQPYYPTAVRLRNQLEFSVFGVSPLPNIIYGNHGQLLETGYVQEYCARNLMTFLPQATAWAPKIRQLQDAEEAQGRTFLYIVTPSKVAQYPDDLPPGMPCLSTPRDRAGLLPAWAALIRRNGVHMVNTAAILSAAHGTYRFRLFPRDGTHWNQVGSTIAAQAIEAALASQRRDGSFKPFTFTWKLASHPDRTDADLGILMNLFWLPAGPEVPVVTLYQPPPVPDCRRTRIVIIGGSFMERIGADLAGLPCGATVVEYFYWKIDRISWDKNGAKSTVPVNPAWRDEELQHADIILYEENESLLGHSRHGEAFYQWLRMPKTAGR